MVPHPQTLRHRQWKRWAVTLTLASISGILFVLALSLWGHGSFAQMLVHLIIGAYLTPVALGVALVAGVWWFQSRSRLAERMMRWAIALALFLVVQLAAEIPIGHGAANYYQGQARAYCETLVPLLEQYAADYGEYPESLERLDDLPPMPAFLRDETFYHRDGADAYTFTVRDDRHLFAWWTLERGSTDWEHVVD